MRLEELIFDNLTLVIISILFIFITTKLLSNLIAKRKAKLELFLEEKTIAMGEQANGKLVITALKNLDIKQINISLNISMTRRNAKGQRKSRKIYKEIYPFNNSLVLRSDQQDEMTFTIAMPSKHETPDVFNKIKRCLNSDQNLDCDIIAKVTCKGVNLKTKKRLVFIEKGFNHDKQEDSLFH